MLKQKINRGFTIIEILVVIIIIIIFVFIAWPNITNWVDKRDTEKASFEIIKKIPKCKFWFIGTKNEFIASKFKERISMMCTENGLFINDFFVFYPQTSYQNYLNLINRKLLFIMYFGCI